MTDRTVIQTVDGNAISRDTPQTLPADPMVSMIERIALDPNADLDKLERMLAMKERMDAQNAKVAFTDALSASRADIPPIIKDATVDFSSQKGRTHYKHETLAGIAKTIDPILSQNGLSYRFRTDQADGRVIVTCIVSHRDGYSEETTLSGSPDQSGSKNTFQAVGSAVTYLQRYTLKAALGLSAEIDDDGQSAGQATNQKRVEKHQENSGDETISIDEYNALKAKAEKAGVPLERLCEAAGISFLPELPKSLLEKMNKKLDLTIAEREEPQKDQGYYAEAIDHYGADNE